MTHSASNASETSPGEPANDATLSLGDGAGASAELPLERSRFSRWLASFGLGETTIPLLRPLKSPRHGPR